MLLQKAATKKTGTKKTTATKKPTTKKAPKTEAAPVAAEVNTKLCFSGHFTVKGSIVSHSMEV